MKKRHADSSVRPKIKAFWKALDEATFGSERTLNLRDSLPSAAEARARTDAWLRSRQVTRTEEVLVITGRGSQGVGGIGVIRREILGMLPSMRRRGIVESWREHTPGSLVIKLAPLSSLFSAGKRRRDAATETNAPSGETIPGLRAETRRALRQLAMQNLDLLGVVATDEFIEQEMARTFSTLIPAISDSGDKESALHAAIVKAIEEQLNR